MGYLRGYYKGLVDMKSQKEYYITKLHSKGNHKGMIFKYVLFCNII